MKRLLSCFTALVAFALVAGAQALTLTSPENGATVPLLSEKQKAFMRMTREERAPFFDDAQPKKERYAVGKLNSLQVVKFASGNCPTIPA